MNRFNSLLDTFELHNRMIENIANVHSIVNTSINWEKVNRIRSEMKCYSLEYLKANLK